MKAEVLNMVFKKIRLVGVSNEGYQQAIESAFTEAKKTLEHIRWFEIVKLSGAIDKSAITEYQAEVDFAFKVERS